MLLAHWYNFIFPNKKLNLVNKTLLTAIKFCNFLLSEVTIYYNWYYFKEKHFYPGSETVQFPSVSTFAVFQ